MIPAGPWAMRPVASGRPALRIDGRQEALCYRESGERDPGDSHDRRGRRCVRHGDPRDRGAARGRGRPAGHRRPGPSARRGQIRGPRHRRRRQRHGTLHHHGDRPRDPGEDREPAPGPRDPRPHRPGEPLVPDPGHRRRSAALRVPSESPADAQLPRRAHHGPGSLGRQPVPHRQGRRRRVLRGRPGAGRDLRGPRGHRDRERAAARAGPAARHRRRAGSHRPGPARRDHPEHLRRGPVAGGRARADPGRPRGGGAAGRARHRQPARDDPGHPQLHLRPPAGAAERHDPHQRPGGCRRGVPPQLDDRRRAARRRRRRRSPTPRRPGTSWAWSTRP